MDYILRLGWYVLLLFILSGCSTTVNREYALNFNTAKNINPTLRGEAAPIMINIYQLKMIDKFNNANFFSLYQNPKDTLGKDLISLQVLTLFPGQNKTLKLALSPAAKNLGILAAFNNIDTSSSWLLTIPLKPKAYQKATVSVLQNNLVLGGK